MSKHVGQEIKQTDHVYWFVTHWLWIWNESADQLCFAHLWFMLIANFKRMIPASKHVNACSHLNLSIFVHLCVIQKGSLEHGSSVSLHHKAPQCHSELSGRRRIDWRQLEKTCKEKIDIRWILELAKICSCITVKLKTLKSIWIDTGETIESTLLNAHSKRILSTAISIKMSFFKASWMIPAVMTTQPYYTSRSAILSWLDGLSQDERLWQWQPICCTMCSLSSTMELSHLFYCYCMNIFSLFTSNLCLVYLWWIIPVKEKNEKE